MNSIDFLKLVWGDRRSWIDLPSKVNGYWVPWHHRWPCEDAVIERRVRSCVEDGEDLYFSVAQFSRRGRDIRRVLSSAWLWADLDEVEPGAAAQQGLLPTLVWRSSPGRYQALWQLDRRLRPEVQSRLNRRLSYTLGADSGGWDATQVLRVPGTRNFKYEGGPTVEVMLSNDKVWHPGRMWRVLKKLNPDYSDTLGVRVTPEATASSGVGRVLPPLPVRVQRLLNVGAEEVVVGERSDRRWELECALLEAGCTEDQTVGLVEGTPWHTWKSVTPLRKEIRKAARHVAGQNGAAPKVKATAVKSTSKPSSGGAALEIRVVEEPTTSLPFLKYSSFMAMNMEAPRWLIEEIWTAGSHGILGGEPKVSKSTLALAMGLSIASGKPFLGEFSVPASSVGPVLMVQEENAPWVMQDRMRKIARFYGLIRKDDYEVAPARPGEAISQRVFLEFPDDVPFRLLNNYGFSMADEDHREMLETAIDAVRPKMVILDPLYQIIGGANVDRQNEITPFLKWLTYLRYEYGVAPLVIHHYRKAKEGDQGGRGGQRLMGSGLFHAWVEASMYAERLELDGREGAGDDVLGVKLEREFRNVGTKGALELQMTMGEPGDLSFDARVVRWSVEGQLLMLVKEAGGSITVNAAAETLGVDRRTIRRYARGSESMVMEGGKRGRGHSWTVRLA